MSINSFILVKEKPYQQSFFKKSNVDFMQSVTYGNR